MGGNTGLLIHWKRHNNRYLLNIYDALITVKDHSSLSFERVAAFQVKKAKTVVQKCTETLGVNY